MIVITRNGRTVVYTGWRAWLMTVGIMLIAWTVLAVLAFLWIGFAITLGFALLLFLPAAMIVILVTSLMGRRG